MLKLVSVSKDFKCFLFILNLFVFSFINYVGSMNCEQLRRL